MAHSSMSRDGRTALFIVVGAVAAALTLMIGIFMTLFTAIIITRQFVEISLSGGASNFSFGQPKLQD